MKRFTHYILFISLLFFSAGTKGQIPDKLIADNCNDSIKCKLRFQISKRSYNNLRNSRGKKIIFTSTQLNFNGSDIPVKSLKIRGKTSLYYPKKSFTLKLKKKLSIQGIYDTVQVKDCYLLGLTMDKNYIDNYSAYSMLSYLKIFNLAFNYCEVIINDKSQGIYLMVERPGDYAFKTLKSPVLIRRGFEGKMEEMKLESKDEGYSAKYFRKKFSQMYKLCNKYSGSQLYDSLDNYINIRKYMQWLGFNYIARNGDYTDELYLYFNTTENRFEVIPWDYDDLYVLFPHEGKENRNAVEGGEFIFSSEDPLDRAIIEDKYLYGKYLEELIYVTNMLNNSVVAEIFQTTLCSVLPYYLDYNIMETTQHDKYGKTNMNDLVANIRQKLLSFSAMRDVVKMKINLNSE